MSMVFDPRVEYEHYQRELRANIESGVLPELDSREQNVITYIRQGMPQAVAARMAGMTISELTEFRKDPRFEITLEFAMARTQTSVEITRDMLNYMALEAHSLSRDTTEAIKALDFLAKLNGLYEQARARGRVIEMDANPTSVAGMRNLSDAQLLAQSGLGDLEPTPRARESQVQAIEDVSDYED